MGAPQQRKKRTAPIRDLADAEEIFEVPLPASRPRTLEDLVTEMAQARASALEIRRVVEPLVERYVRERGEDPDTWAVYCEWRGATLRCVVYDMLGNEFDHRAIVIGAAAPT